MNYVPGTSFVAEFTTSNPTTMAAANADSLPVATANHNGSDDSSFSLTVTNITTGRYKITGNVPSGYVAGDTVCISVAATVAGTSGVKVVDKFGVDAVNLSLAVPCCLGTYYCTSTGNCGLRYFSYSGTTYQGYPVWSERTGTYYIWYDPMAAQWKLSTAVGTSNNCWYGSATVGAPPPTVLAMAGTGTNTGVTAALTLAVDPQTIKGRAIYDPGAGNSVHFNTAAPPSAVQIASAVWTDVISGDFTTSNSSGEWLRNLGFYLGQAGGVPLLNGNGNLNVNLVLIADSPITDSDTGRMAAAFQAQYNVTSPTFTNACINQTGDVGTVLSRLTNARAGYLDNLNVGGPVASHADISAINQSASRQMILGCVAQFEIPASGSASYTIEMRTYNDAGTQANADSTPTLAVVAASGDNLTANLSGPTSPSAGCYRWIYSVASGASPETQLRFDGGMSMSGLGYTLSVFSQIVSVASAPFTTTLASELTAIYNALPAYTPVVDSSGAVAATPASVQAGLTAQGFTSARATALDSLATAADVAAGTGTVTTAITAAQTAIENHGDANWQSGGGGTETIVLNVTPANAGTVSSGQVSTDSEFFAYQKLGGTYLWPVVDQTGAPINLVGKSLALVCWPHGFMGEPVWTLTTAAGGGLTVTGTANNVIEWTIAPVNTPAPGVFGLALVDLTDNLPLPQGVLNIQPMPPLPS